MSKLFARILLIFIAAIVGAMYFLKLSDAKKEQKFRSMIMNNENVSEVYDLRYYEDRVWFIVKLKGGGVISFSGLDESSFDNKGRISIDAISDIQIGCRRSKQGVSMHISGAFNLNEFLEHESKGRNILEGYDDTIQNYDYILNLIQKLPLGESLDNRYIFPKNPYKELGYLFCYQEINNEILR